MDAKTMQDAAMEGTARYMEWRQKFLNEWQEGVQKEQLKMLWMLMPPEQKEQMKKDKPEQYKQIVDYLEIQ